MFEEILTAISLGQRLLRSLAALRRDAKSFRSETAHSHAGLAQLEALDQRTSDLETIAQEQDARIGEVETILRDSMVVTEALARRVGTIFWIAVSGCVAGVAGLILAIVVVTRAGH